MKKVFFITFLFVFQYPINLIAQLNLLTDQEVISIIDRVPDIANALKDECPIFSSTIWYGDIVSIQVRRSCGPHAGQLVGNYQVNKRNGEVITGWDNPLPVLDIDGEAFAKQIVAQAQERILSLDEAKCLVKEAAKNLPELKKSSTEISIKLSENTISSDNLATFIITDNSNTPHNGKERKFNINLDEVKIYENDSDISVVSPGIDNLVSKLLGLRAPMLLIEREIKDVIIAIPEIANLLTDECVLYARNESLNRSIAGVGCNSSVSIKTVYINPQTGEVTDPETGKSLDTPESKKLARLFFDQKLLNKSQLEKEIEVVCRP